VPSDGYGPLPSLDRYLRIKEQRFVPDLTKKKIQLAQFFV
jgi:hypothetical protein